MPVPVGKQHQADNVSERGERVAGELPEEREGNQNVDNFPKRTKTKKKVNLRRAGSAKWGRRRAMLLSNFSSGLSLFFSTLHFVGT